MLRWVIPFLEWKLKGDARFAAFFDAPVPPGVELAASPGGSDAPASAPR